jgi:hypothetical protein
MRPHPHLYEINTWPWLDSLSRRAGRTLNLGAVPDREWDALHRRGIDVVYLMGIWKRSPLGRLLALGNLPLFRAFDSALPGWQPADVAGSAFCIAGYEPDARIGTWDDLASVRAQLHARNMRLFVDFIPNHTGFDHPWVQWHPDRYVQGEVAAFRQNPDAFRVVETASGDVRFIACGRDPYFDPWHDVAQLDYSSPDTRAAMIAELKQLALRCDGVRCDMAMLVLSDVFGETWRELLTAPMPRREFWSDARAAVPSFGLMAEVYWDLEWRLQELGFDFTYDKRLYDRLLHAPAADVRSHLMADGGYQRRSARFVENHDEPRSIPAFGGRSTAAAVAASTIQGLRFFYDGQFEGRTDHLPVQLGRWHDMPDNVHQREFYDRLLSATNHDVFHHGQWRLLDVNPAGDESSGNLVAWRWTQNDEVRIVIVNLGAATAQGLVPLWTEMDGTANDLVFEDLLNGARYPWSRAALHLGLYVKLDPGGAHILRTATPTAEAGSAIGS